MVVLELRVNDLDVRFVLPEQGAEVLKAPLNSGGKAANGLRLRRGDPSEDSLGRQQHVVAEVIPAHTLGIRNRVDFAKYCDELLSFNCVLLGVDHDPALVLLPALDRHELFLQLNRLRDEPAGIRLNEHELEHVNLLVSYPCLIKLL